MTQSVLGIVGGSGFYNLPGLAHAEWRRIESPWGAPSDDILFADIDGLPIRFLPRHGRGHKLSPSDIDYRANVDALKRAGVTDLVSVSACGSLKKKYKPGDFVLPDQFIDRTHGRPQSFFGEGLVAHVSLADPVCARLSGLLADAAQAAGASVHRGGCYLAMQGPQFSTRAESRLYRQWGADVIGMTAMPEARLAREAELPYALIGMVTDYDAWRDGDHVDVAQVLSVMRGNAATAKATVVALAGLLPQLRTPSPIDRALDGAIMTAPAQRDPVLVARLGAVAGRALKT